MDHHKNSARWKAQRGAEYKPAESDRLEGSLSVTGPVRRIRIGRRGGLVVMLTLGHPF
jgi:hypothetical protein